MFSRFFRKTEFAKNVLTLMTGTAIAQAIPIAISPILTRLYSPDDFGVFGLYIAIVSILSVVAALRYELAIMLPKEDKDAFSVLSISIINSLIFSFIVFIVVLIFHNTILNVFVRKFSDINVNEISILLYLIPLSVLLVSLFQTFNYWSTRQKTFKVNALGRISQSSVYSLSAFGLGYTSLGPSGLILGNVLGYLTAASTLFIRSFRSLRSLFPTINKQRIKTNIKTYKAFPIINTPHAFLGTLQEHGAIFIITYFFSSFIVGFYSFTNRIMNLPMGLIGASMYQVFYQKASTMYNNNENIRPVLLKLYFRSFIIGLPVFLTIFIFAPHIFALIFSEKWRFSGEIAQIITPMIFINFIASPVSSLPLITNNQKKAIIIALVDFTIRITSVCIGGLLGNFKTGLLIMTIGCSCLLIYALFWFYKIAEQVDSKPKN